jgi:osmoprotectant transport system substrate-binding protein
VRGARLAPGLAILLACLLTLTACTQMKANSGGSGSADEIQDGGRITVGGADFTEMLIMQSLYGLLLTKAGYRVDYRSVAGREVYEPLLESGAITVAPEYAATMAEFLNRKLNGAKAPVIAGANPGRTIEAMRPLARSRGLDVLAPAAASSQTGFAIDAGFARRRKIATLSQYAALGRPVILASTAQCARSPFCQIGLQQVYGMRITKVLPLGFGSAASKDAVSAGEASMAQVGTTDGTLPLLGLQLLADDKQLQLAENLVPVVNRKAARSPRIASALAPLAAKLTTEDLAQLNDQVNTGQRSPQEVAQDYLEEKKLL